jgi:O-antigen/teichoic acid export membrane protein
MNTFSQRMLANPKYSKIFEWGKLISITGSAQVLVQGAALVTGILIIRMLPTKEYAFYTLANTMLGTMTVLADGGISAGVMAQGGKVWKDKDKLGQVLATGLDLRRRFAVLSLMVALPILMYLLWHQQASWLVIGLVVLTIIPSFFSALSDSLLEIVPKLHQAIKPLQFNQVSVGVFRLLLSSLSIFIFPFTFVALLANGIPRIVGNLRLRKIAFNYADKEQKPDPVVRQEILKSVKRIMPGSIYYCVSGQITIWLISFFGSTEAIAKLGALGRFAMLLTVFTVLFSTLITPRFARLKDDKRYLLKKFMMIQIGLVSLCTLICLTVYLFPQPALWLLGSKFQGLETELSISIIASCLSLMSGTFFGLLSSRGWPTHPAVLIPGNIIFVIAGALLFNVSTLQGALWFNVFINLFPVLAHSCNFYYQIYKK